MLIVILQEITIIDILKGATLMKYSDELGQGVSPMKIPFRIYLSFISSILLVLILIFDIINSINLIKIKRIQFQ